MASDPNTPQELTSADINWLIGLVEAETEHGHCGEGTLERRQRQQHNDRLDRLMSALRAMLSAAPTRKEGGWPTREEVARVIDPGAWAVMDSELGRVKRLKNAGYDPDNFKDKRSLAKADAVIALFPIQPPSVGGSSVAESAASVAPQPDCSAAQSFEGKGEPDALTEIEKLGGEWS